MLPVDVILFQIIIIHCFFLCIRPRNCSTWYEFWCVVSSSLFLIMQPWECPFYLQLSYPLFDSVFLLFLSILSHLLNLLILFFLNDRCSTAFFWLLLIGDPQALLEWILFSLLYPIKLGFSVGINEQFFGLMGSLPSMPHLVSRTYNASGTPRALIWFSVGNCWVLSWILFLLGFCWISLLNSFSVDGVLSLYLRSLIGGFLLSDPAFWSVWKLMYDLFQIASQPSMYPISYQKL